MDLSAHRSVMAGLDPATHATVLEQSAIVVMGSA